MFGPVWWILGVLAAVWIIYDILTNQKHMKKEHKIIWVICAIVFSILTAIVYFIVVKKGK